MRVFISYRREDTSGQAGRLYDALADQLGPNNVFMDVDTIDIGVEFKHAIESAVTACDVLFAMIGPRWLTVADSRGERRLSRADDYVRLEIETALGRNIRVVPALVGGASMPSGDDLPGTLAPLALRNAVEMADGPRWQYDVSRLMNLLERIGAGERHPEVAPPLAPGALAAAAAVAPPEPEAPARAETPGDAEPHDAAGGAPASPAARPEPPDDEPAREAPSAPARSATGAAAAFSAGAGGAGAPPPPAAGDGGGGGGGTGGWQGGSSGHGPGGPKSGGISDAPRWLLGLAGLGVVALLALALGIAYQLGGDESSGSGGQGPTQSTPVHSTTTDTTSSTAVPQGADPDQAKLWVEIPKTIRGGSCKFADTEHAGGLATVNCDYNDPKHGRTLVHLDRFIDFTHLQLIYKVHGPGEVLARGGSPDPNLKVATGGCNRTHWRGEGPWSHESGGVAMGPVSGRYSCYQTPGQCDLVAKMKLKDLGGPTCSVIVWTDVAANMFVKAEQQSPVHAGIASFYDFWHHQFG